MTAPVVRPVWTPDDFRATVAAAQRQAHVDLTAATESIEDER